MDSFSSERGAAAAARRLRQLRLRARARLKPLLVLRYLLLGAMNLTLLAHALVVRRTLSPLPWLYLATLLALARIALAAYYNGHYQMRPMVLEVPSVPGVFGAGSPAVLGPRTGLDTSFVVSEVDLWLDLFWLWALGLLASFLHFDKGLWPFLGFLGLLGALFCTHVLPGYFRIRKAGGKGGPARVLYDSVRFVLQGAQR